MPTSWWPITCALVGTLTSAAIAADHVVTYDAQVLPTAAADPWELRGAANELFIPGAFPENISVDLDPPGLLRVIDNRADNFVVARRTDADLTYDERIQMLIRVRPVSQTVGDQFDFLGCEAGFQVPTSAALTDNYVARFAIDIDDNRFGFVNSTFIDSSSYGGVGDEHLYLVDFDPMMGTIAASVMDDPGATPVVIPLASLPTEAFNQPTIYFGSTYTQVLSETEWFFVGYSLGEIVDCNGNGVDDALDIASGLHNDFDGNGIPDVCEIGSVIHVDANMSPSGPGDSWGNALRHLQDALALAEEEGSPATEIWVAEGIYYPDEGADQVDNDRDSTFTMHDGIVIYGGFAGTETSVDDRDIEAHPSILSGDLLGDDAANFVNYDDNVIHVVNATGVTPSATIDGFCITAGSADDPVEPEFASGGGLVAYLDGAPTIRNCTFLANRAGRNGGGAYIEEGYIENCRFLGNRSLGWPQANGGGLSMTRGVVTGCVFAGNLSIRGAGFIGFGAGGGIGGTITGCSFTNNGDSASLGGAMHIAGPWKIVNCTAWNNTALTGRTAYIPATGSATVEYCCVREGLSNQGGQLIADPQINIFDVDPQFIDPLGPDGLAGTPDDDLRLPITSPCIDAGNSNADIDDGGALDPIPPLDLDNHPRFVDVPTVPDGGTGSTPRVDIGAYEYQTTTQWTGGGDGQNRFSDPDNWSLGEVPSDISTVELVNDSPSTIEIKFGANAFSERLLVREGDWRFAFEDTDYTVLGQYDPLLPAVVIGAESAGQVAGLTIENDGVAEHGLIAGSVVLADVPGAIGNLVVNGSGAYLETTDFTIGEFGEGYFSLLQSRAVSSGTVTLAKEPGSVADATLSFGALWEIDAPDITIGDNGSATLTVAPSSTLQFSAAGTVDVGSGSEGSGTIIVDGATASIIGASTDVNIGVGGAALLDLRGMATVQLSDLEVGPSGEITGSGIIDADVRNKGVIRPVGDLPGQFGEIIIQGEFDQVPVQGQATERAGLTVLRVGGDPMAPGHDRLTVTSGAAPFGIDGLAKLGGGLRIDFEDGFDLDPGFEGTLPILDSAFVLDSFSVTVVPAIANDTMGAARRLVPTYAGTGPGGGGVSLTIESLGSLDFGGVNELSSDNLAATANSIAVGDFDGVNGDDFIIALDSGAAFYFENDGTGTMVQTQAFSLGDDLTDLAAADFNGDGNLDFAIARDLAAGTDEVDIFLGDGTGSFATLPDQVIPTASGPVGIAAGDFNHDGGMSADLAVATAGGTPQVTLYSSGGSTLETINLPVVPDTIDPGRFDRDKDLDFAILSRGEATIVAYFHDGGGTHTQSAEIVVDDGPLGLVITDIDDDGRVDIVTANDRSGNDDTLSIALRANDNDLEFEAALSVTIPSSPRDLAIIDIDNDGDDDLSFITASGTVEFLRNDTTVIGQATLTTLDPETAGVSPTLLAAGDFTPGDDLDDVLVIDSGTGPGAMSSFRVQENTTAPPPPPCPADVNGDATVNFSDVLPLLTNWGACPGCPEDINGDDVVNFGDLLIVLSAWGPC